MKDAALLTPAEFEVMEVLWAVERPLAVSDVLAQLQLRRDLAYTTVMTVLDKLARKGSVTRSKRGKAYFYRPGVERAQARRRAVGELVEVYFNGSRGALKRFLSADSSRRPSSSPARPLSCPSADRIAEQMDVALL